MTRPTPHARFQSLALALASGASKRDAQGGHAAAERQLIRDSGLLALTVPTEFGGEGADWSTLSLGVRHLATVDSSLAHVLAFHHLQVATIGFYGDRPQRQALLAGTVRHGWFWGNALNPNDRRTTVTEAPDGWALHGSKGWCSGSVGADWLTVSAWHEDTGSLLIGCVPAARQGITVAGDWNAFGQKQTDSGTVRFEQVRLSDAEVLVRPGHIPTPRHTLRSLMAQSVLVNLYAGLARGALSQGLFWTRERTRPWMTATVERAVDDLHVQRRYGELTVVVRGAELLADEALRQIDVALRRGEALTPADRGEVAIAVTQAKVASHRAAMHVSSEIFELMGASATSASQGLDRFWRNARVHTLHDPIDLKLQDLGQHALTDRWPQPTHYG